MLDAVTGIDQLHRAAFRGLDGGADVVVVHGLLSVDADDDVPHLQARRLGGIGRAGGGADVGEGHHHRAVGEHFDAKGRSADGDGPPVHHHGPHRLDRDASQHRQGHIIASAGGHCLGCGGPFGCLRHQPGHLSQGKGLPLRHHEGVRDLGIKIGKAAQRQRGGSRGKRQAAPDECEHTNRPPRRGANRPGCLARLPPGPGD